jgi:hypothetical protein
MQRDEMSGEMKERKEMSGASRVFFRTRRRVE